MRFTSDGKFDKLQVVKPNNPFVTVGYFGPEYFCDRKQETAKLLSSIRNDCNVTLMAPRRYGKTGLINNLFHQLPNDCVPVYLDIYSLTNLTEFTRAFSTAVTSVSDSPLEKATKSVLQFFRSCRPTITPQDDGRPKFSFDVAPANAEVTLRDAFAYLKSRERRLVIAIDEFQQIREFPEQGTEALLRSLVQEVPWVRFIFAGSRHHIMGDMFLAAKHPFYNSTDILSLKPIEPKAYADFAASFFRKASQPFSGEVFKSVYDRFDGITWYVQRVMKGVWNNGHGLSSPEDAELVIRELVEDRDSTFSDLLGSQNDVAKRLLRAVAREGCVREPTAAAFLSRYSLCPSSVRSTIADLQEREILYRSDSGIVIYERLFGEWLKLKEGVTK